MKLGVCMEGLEDFVLKEFESTMGLPDQWNYLEIGVAEGETLAAITALARARLTGKWRTIGVDLEDGWSLSRPQIDQRGIVIRTNPSVSAPRGCPSLYLCGSERYLTKGAVPPLSLVLIDGCHERECAARDFTLLEPFVAPGGVVMFHDAGQRSVGGSQPHQNKPIDVYGALEDLHLLDGTRPGWSPLRWCAGYVDMAATTKLS